MGMFAGQVLGGVRTLSTGQSGRPRDYIIALLAATLALLVRAALDPFLQSDHAFVLSLMAVVFVSWQCGFGPAVLTLLVSMTGTVYFFVEYRETFVIASRSDQLAIGLFIFCGIGSAALGHSKRLAHQRAEAALAEALEQRAGLEAEVARRRVVESALRQREVELQESAARFRLLTEAVPQIVWNADPDGRASYWNSRWREYTGRPTEDARDRAWLAAVHPHDADRVGAAWDMAVIQGADRFAQELRLRGADGEFRWMLAAAVPLRRADGAVDQWIGSMADIDDQKRQAETLERMVRDRTAALEQANAALRAEIAERQRAEDQVRTVAKELQRSNRELEQFAYVASHDLQEPLRKIQAFGDRLRDKHRDELGEQGRDFVDRMRASAGRMGRLIDDLLSFSRVTTQARPFARVDLNEVLAEVVEDLAARVEQTDGAVEVEPLPTLDADPIQMRQLFQNLVGNALKFHKPGEPPTVRVAGRVEDGVCRVSVADAGIGFDEKYLGRIFQVFQRLHGRDAYEGTGVGLAICRKIAERHGGTITAVSKPGEGATFTLTVPAQRPARPTAMPEPVTATESLDPPAAGA